MRSAGGGQAEVRIQPRQALRLRAGRDRADPRVKPGDPPDGFPLAYEVMAGNTSDKTTLRAFLAKIEAQYGSAKRTWVMDRGIPTEEVLAEMRASQTPIHYLVGTPRGRLTKLEKALAAKPWEDVRESVRVKLIEQEQETYVFARSQARREKEQAMRRRRLRKLIKRLRELQGQNLTRDELLLKLGAAKKEAGKAYGLLTIHTPTKDQPVTPQTFHFALDRKKLRIARRREGGYLLRSNIRGDDPGHLWRLYLQLVEIDIDQTWRLSRIKGWRVCADAGKQGATEWQGCRAGGFESGDCRRVGGDELVEAPQHFDRAAAQPPFLDPVVDRAWGRADFGGQFVDRPFVRATVKDGPRGPSLGLDPPRADQDAPDHRAVEGVATLRRPPAFVVEDQGDLDAIAARPVKFTGPGGQVRIGAERFELGDRPHQFMRGSVAALPMALQAELLAAADHSDDDAFQQQSGDRLALLLGRGLGPPKGGKILGQILDGGQFGRARRLGPLPLKALVVGQQTRLLAERRLPILLQRAGHQPVLGLDAGVTAAGLVDLMPRPFEALAPMLV